MTLALVERSAFDFSSEREARWLEFAENRFGTGVMPAERLEGLMKGGAVTHLLVCRDEEDGNREAGVALMYLEPVRMAHYYYAFYDLRHSNRRLGLFLMTAAVEYFSRAGFGHLYLGTCYSERALYKTQFDGVEFHDGLGWSPNLDQLKFMVRRDENARHLLEEPEFLAWHGGFEGLVRRSGVSTPAREVVTPPAPGSH